MSEPAPVIRYRPLNRRLPYGDKHPALTQLKDPRALVYRVVKRSGPIDDREFPNAWSALAWGHEQRVKGLWWVAAVMGVE
jgi:hypothetical protein